MNPKRTYIIIPEDLAGEIDRLVGKRGRSGFFAQAARKELKRVRLLKALERAAGLWTDDQHPELKKGAGQWVKSLRKADEGRFQRLKKRSNG